MLFGLFLVVALSITTCVMFFLLKLSTFYAVVFLISLFGLILSICGCVSLYREQQDEKRLYESIAEDRQKHENEIVELYRLKLNKCNEQAREDRKIIQEMLNEKGYTGKDGQPLKITGMWSNDYYFALDNFQKREKK